jgi:uncharacterized DUF497 family protein
MVFEYDPVKSESNRIKHGIDFLEAQALWSDPMLLEIPAKTTDEPRYLVIGLLGDKHWSAVMTYRGDKIRLISVRRARAEEVALYES